MVLKTELEVSEFLDHFLGEVYRYHDGHRIRRGIRYIFAKLNALLANESYGVCDSILVNVDVNKINVDFVLSFLTITRAARYDLYKRDDYLKRARIRITALRGKEVAEKLLRNM